jgi:hypothetical protein
MLKKTLLSVAVASSIALTGCLDDAETGNNSQINYEISNPNFSGQTYPVFNPVTSKLPLPNDIIIDSTAGDGTYKVSDTSPPVTTALNKLSGASTVAPIDIQMSGAVDAATVDGRAFLVTTDAEGKPSVIPNPTQNVFLIELDYASEEPLTALSAGEKPTIPVAVTAAKAAAGDAASGAALYALATNPQYEASVVDLNDGTSLIRINPLQPLNPRKRYIVAVTKEVKDVSGLPLVSSPSYQTLTLTLDDGSYGPVGNNALAPIQKLINGFWEPLAATYFGLNNSVRAATGLPALTMDSIALSYSLTTSNDKAVLGYMAEPNTWFTNTLRTAVTTGARKAHLAAGLENSYDAIKATVDGAIAAWPNEETQKALGEAYLYCASVGATAGVPAMTCLGSVISNSLENAEVSPGVFVDLIGTRPSAKTVSFTGSSDAAQISAVLSAVGVKPGEVSVAMGSMKIPYFLGLPSGSDGTAIQANMFTANDTLATTLNAKFGSIGLTLPQANPEVTDVVNYLFPFPKKTDDVTIPVIAMYPTGAAMDTGALPVVIYQHGITTDRSAALTYGSLLAKTAGVVVVAIDQPLHGVDAISTDSKKALATSLLTAAGQTADDATVNAVLNGTFSVGALLSIQSQGCPLGITDPTDATQIATATQAVLSGSCGATAAASLGGALVIESTVANGASTIPGLPRTDYERHFNFTANASQVAVPMDFNPDTASGSSGSLFVNLTNFLNSRDNLRQMVSDLQQLRMSIGNIDLNGNGTPDLSASNVFYIGHSLGTVDGIPFIATVNKTATTADNLVAANLLTPGGGIVRLYENSPTFSPAILGGLAASAGLVQGDASLESYFNVLQMALDAGDAVNFVQDIKGIPTLFSMVIGDQVIPNSAYPAENALGNATPAPLAGSEPLAKLTSATSIHSGANALNIGITRYTGGSHGTPVLPTPGDATAAAVFQEMIGQSVYMIGSGGTTVVVTNPAVVQQAE